MLDPELPVGVAVSGGPDSVCLLHVLLELGYRCEVFHVNHLTRGAESGSDADFVRDLGSRLGIPTWIVKRDVRGEFPDENFEQAARRVRYEEFAKFRLQRGLAAVATGHTLSDQAETLIFRLLRGTGPGGLAGILPVTAEAICRPLIDVRREQVLNYLEERRIPFRIDQSNSDVQFSRNRIRAEVVPVLKQWNPNLEESLGQLADLAFAEELYWQQVTANCDVLGRPHRGGWILDATTTLQMPLALQRRWVRQFIARTKGDLQQVEFQHVEAILELATKSEGHGRLQIPGIDVYRSFHWLWIAPLGVNAGLEGRFFQQMLPKNGSIVMPDGVQEVWILTEGAVGSANAADEIDGDLLAKAGNALLRTWTPGDVICLTDSANEVKIKVLFQEEQIPVWERKFWPVIEAGGQVVWSKRFGVAAGFRPRLETQRFVRVEVKEISR